MASLTIRNLTVTPLELKAIERSEKVPAFDWTCVWRNITSNITGLFFNATATSNNSGHLSLPAAPIGQEVVKGALIGPFCTWQSDIRAADPRCEELRLTFAATEKGQECRYTVDVPGSSPRSLVLTRESNNGNTEGAGAGLNDFTAVYVPTGAFLAIYSSGNLPRWMGELHDSLPLSVLSIPGTHNSPTCHVALPSVRCQAVSVSEQLRNGVRFLDVRASVPAEVPSLPTVGGESAATPIPDLSLAHGAFPISLTGGKYLADLLAECYAFLDANPSETLLMSLKREGTGRGRDADLARCLASARYCGGGDGESATKKRWFTEARVPSLGEVRGRIVLLRRFGLPDDPVFHGTQGFGIDASSWPDNCADGVVGGGCLRVQDFYEVTQTAGIARKIELCRAHLERAGQLVFQPVDDTSNASSGTASAASTATASGTGPLPFFLNFLSGSSFFNPGCWPERIAAKVNPSMIEYLCMRHGEGGKGPGSLPVGEGGTGVVITDWVGHRGDWDLIRCIVGWNARLQLKG